MNADGMEPVARASLPARLQPKFPGAPSIARAEWRVGRVSPCAPVRDMANLTQVARHPQPGAVRTPSQLSLALWRPGNPPYINPPKDKVTLSLRELIY